MQKGLPLFEPGPLIYINIHRIFLLILIILQLNFIFIKTITHVTTNQSTARRRR